MRFKTILTGAPFLLVAAVGFRPALAHEDAVLESSVSEVAAGHALPLKGSDLEARQAYRLKLVGALDELDLREVIAGADGTFSIDLEVPVSVRPGVYKITATAPDGDEVASLDVTIVRPAPARTGEAEDEPEAEAGAGHLEESARMARDDEMVIERSRSGIEWGVIGLLIGLAGGLGVGLLRRA